MKQIILNGNDKNQRLDKFLSKLMPKLPKSMLYKGLRKNCVRINGKHIKDGSFRLSENDVLSLYFDDVFFEKPDYSSDFKNISPKLDIVYEDENILIINKPQGVLVHEDDLQNPDNLLSHIKAYLYKKGEYLPEKENSFAPALANRIDLGTGGIVISAKNSAALRILNEKIKNREIKKYYLCLAYGHFDKKNGEISGYILRDTDNHRVVFSENGSCVAKNAVTLYRVIREYPGYSLVEAELKTGRTHQIRAGFAFIGHPLLGDTKYAPKSVIKGYNYKYQALFAYKIEFDFLGDAGILKYLDKQVFEIKDVHFMQK